MVVHKKSAIVVVFNDNNQIALQLRAPHDDSYPAHWDFSAGGGIEQGETPLVAAIRELKEEIGVVAEMEPVTEMQCTYPAWQSSNVREVDLSIFKTRYNGRFTLDSNEVEKIEFFDLETIQNMVDEGEKFHPEFLFAWNAGIITQAAK